MIDRLVSPFSQYDRRVLGWSVQAFCFSETFTIQKTTQTKQDSTKKPHQIDGSKGKIYVYRRYFEKIRELPKSLRGQILVELLMDHGLRSGEASSQRIELCDLANGLLHVLDSKKGTLRIVPMRYRTGKHIATHIQVLKKSYGFLIQSRRKVRKPNSKTQGEGISDCQIGRILAHYCIEADVPVMAPRMFRAYCASKWMFVDHKSIYHLKALLGHDDIQSTEHYVNKLVDVDDFVEEFHQGEEQDGGKVSPFSLSICARSESCPLSAPNCHCRMFIPSENVVVKTK
jgi:integrase